MLIGDKTGPAIIAAVYGDLRKTPVSASEADSMRAVQPEAEVAESVA